MDDFFAMSMDHYQISMIEIRSNVFIFNTNLYCGVDFSNVPFALEIPYIRIVALGVDRTIVNWRDDGSFRFYHIALQ